MSLAAVGCVAYRAITAQGPAFAPLPSKGSILKNLKPRFLTRLAAVFLTVAGMLTGALMGSATPPDRLTAKTTIDPTIPALVVIGKRQKTQRADATVSDFGQSKASENPTLLPHPDTGGGVRVADL